jgi:glucan biosynthesis protein C
MAMEKRRLGYIENLRVLLTVLVILQHAVRAYGTVIWWFVADIPAPALERFTSVNSSFFMSLFFFISFYFLPASYDRKGFWKFHQDRLLRLFVPLCVYVGVIASVMMYGYFLRFRNYGSISFFDYFSGFYLGLAGKPADWSGPAWPDLNFGPLWFVEHLLVYGLLYSIFRLVTLRRMPQTKILPFPSNGKIAAFAILLGGLSFLVRVKFPLYRWTGLFGFIQTEPAHLPFYVAMFFIGIAAYRNDWLEKLPGKAGNFWLVVGIVSAAAIAMHPIDARFYGGLSLYSLEYALFEALACVGLVIGLPYWFWKRFDEQSPLMKSLAANSYLAFIIHLPIVVALQYLVMGLSVDPVLKFALVSVVSIPATFGLSVLLRKIPLIRKYL